MKKILFTLLFAAILLFCGCELRTADQMYAVPARPAADYNLQDAINKAMSGLDYAAPKSGTNQQIVQTVDIDGNGDMEYLLFAKGDSDNPLQIFIFDKQKDAYTLVDTISCNGSAFDRVEYVQMDSKPGKEIVIGYQLNDQLSGGLCVYGFQTGNMEQLLSTTYTQFLTTDLNADATSELFLVRPGPNEWSKGVAELYLIDNGNVEKTIEQNLAVPSANIRRVLPGKLQDGNRCIYVSGKIGETALSTDVFAIVNNTFANISLSADSTTTAQMIGNYFVEAVDIDGDGVLELPMLMDMVQVAEDGTAAQKIISWYALDSNGNSHQKRYTYHCFADGWFVDLEPQWTQILTASRQGKRVDFFSWDKQYGVPIRLFSINVLTGQNREEQANLDGYIRLHSTTSAVFVGELTSNGEKYGITEQKLIDSFHMIQQDS